MNEILVKRGISSKLARYHTCTPQSVRLALRGITESELSDQIRRTALAWGGLEDKHRRSVPAHRIDTPAPKP